MKKFLALGISAVMACSLFALPACGEDDNGDNKPTAVVEGNYTTLTAENAAQFDTALASVDPEKLAGDPTAEGWNLGASFFADLYLNAKMGENEYQKIDLDATAKISASMAAADATDSLMGVNLKAAASGSLSVESKMEAYSSDPEAAVTYDIVDVDASANAYIDNLKTYVDYTAKGVDGANTLDASGAMKFSTMELLQQVMGGGAVLTSADVSTDGSTDGSTETSPDGTTGGEEVTVSPAQEVLAIAEQYGIVVAYEYSEASGLKLKVSVVEDTIKALIEDTTTTVSVDKCTLDAYLVIDANGLLKKVSVNADVKFSVTDEGEVSTVELKGIVVLDIGAVTVELPADLATNEKYVETPIMA